MEQPLVSIVIPVYNAAPDLARCIESVRKQTYRNIEVFLVNDGSKDASSPICHMYERIDPRVHVIDKENAGVSAARNTGIAAVDAHMAGRCVVKTGNEVAQRRLAAAGRPYESPLFTGAHIQA